MSSNSVLPAPSKTLLILSGGMDSGVLLADLISKNFEISTLSFDYEAKHSQIELRSAKAITSHYNVSHQIININFINKLFKSTLLSSGSSIPLGSYDEENLSSTVVPFRNGIMLSIAAGLAESCDIDSVMIGTHGGDHQVYPDCRPEFNQAISNAIHFGTDKKVQVFAPYQNLNKKSIASIGLNLGFPFEMSWTCYKGDKVHCGECAACIERQGAIGDKDPTKYKI